MNAPKWVKVVVSALIGAIITFGTAYLALLQGLPPEAGPEAIGRTPYLIALVGAALGALKDIQAYLSAPPQ